LGWSQKELAERAGGALNTVHEFEKGRRTPAAYIITATRAAIAAAGIMLLFDEDGGAAGIARRDAQIRTIAS
jgi:transcriptional regulator with XRE-family HTH domain